MIPHFTAETLEKAEAIHLEGLEGQVPGRRPNELPRQGGRPPPPAYRALCGG